MTETFSIESQLKLTAGLEKKNLKEASNLGRVSVSIALRSDAESFEFTCIVVDSSARRTGWHFLGQLKSAQRCFKTPVESIATFIAVLKSSFNADSTLLLIDEPERSKLYWHVRNANDDATIGFVPMRATRASHNVLQSPILFLQVCFLFCLIEKN